MNARTTARLLVAVCALGAAVWFAERRVATTDARRSASRMLIRSDVSEVVGVEITSGDARVECSRANGVWFLAWPPRARADEGGINRILFTLDAMRRGEVITPASLRGRRLTLSDYGLSSPRARVALSTAAGREELLIGDDTPLGEGVYVKLADETCVIATSRRLLDVLPREPNALRDRTFLHGTPQRTMRLEIRRPDKGFLQLAQGMDGWIIQQPITARADGAAVQGLLKTLYGMAAREFAWDPPRPSPAGAETNGPSASPDAAAEAFGLAPDEAAMRVTLWGDTGEAGWEVVFGKPAPGDESAVYVQVGDRGSVYTVDKAALDALRVSADDVRDRRLFALESEAVNCLRIENSGRTLALERSAEGRWRVTEPAQCRADNAVVEQVIRDLTAARVAAFVDPAQTNLADFGLVSPTTGVQLLAARPAEQKAGAPALAGAPPGAAAVPDGTPPGSAGPAAGRRPSFLWMGSALQGRETVFAKFEDEPCVYEIPAAVRSRLGPDPTDPLLYRDRTVLAIGPDQVRRITLSKDGREQTVERNPATDGWRTVTDSVVAVEAALEEILFAAANLRATAIVARNPRDSESYGLDRAGAVLTLGLSGEEGIQKSLLFGSSEPGGGVYSMVQGDDVVFVLDRAAADRLQNDITRDAGGPAPQGGKAEP